MNRYMRLIVMFDLPTLTESNKHTYTKFHKFLLQDGFTMMQFSIYSRICKNGDDVFKHVNRIKLHVPEDGNVRLLQVTEKQYENMIMFCGKQNFEEKIGINPLIVIE